MVRFERSVSGAVSDQEAVEISGRALTAAKFDRELYEPERWDHTNFFARNVYNTNNGYVLWRRKAKGERGLAVEMRIEGSTAVCAVGRTCH